MSRRAGGLTPSRMLFVFGCSNARSCSVLLAHVGAGLRVSVVLVAAEVVDFRTQVRPHHGISGTASLGLSFRRELVGASGSRCRCRSRPAGGRGSGRRRGCRGRRFGRGRSGGGGRSGATCTALLNVSLLRNSLGLIGRLIGQPLCLAHNGGVPDAPAWKSIKFIKLCRFARVFACQRRMWRPAPQATLSAALCLGPFIGPTRGSAALQQFDSN